jgi:hypothetical protein
MVEDTMLLWDYAMLNLTFLLTLGEYDTHLR